MAMANGEELDLGSAGASGRREYERRKARREDRVRERHPHIEGLLLSLQDAPTHEKAWAEGEEALGAFFVKRCPEVVVLHDRRMPGSRANIDHLAITPSGVHVIDAKRYKGKIEVRKPLFGAEKLLIAGRDKTKLLDGLERQADAVRQALERGLEHVPVHACLCFVNPDGQRGGSTLPIMRTLQVRGFPLYYPRRLAKELNKPGELSADRMRHLAESLRRVFPSA